MPEVSAMNRYYWDCPGMQSIPRFHWRQVGIQRKQLGLRGSSAEHPHECRKRSAVQVSKPWYTRWNGRWEKQKQLSSAYTIRL